MRYIMKCAKYRGSKVDHASKSMTSLPIEQLPVVYKELSGSYKMTNGRVYAWKEKQSVVRCREQ